MDVLSGEEIWNRFTNPNQSKPAPVPAAFLAKRDLLGSEAEQEDRLIWYGRHGAAELVLNN